MGMVDADFLTKTDGIKLTGKMIIGELIYSDSSNIDMAAGSVGDVPPKMVRFGPHHMRGVFQEKASSDLFVIRGILTDRCLIPPEAAAAADASSKESLQRKGN